MPVERLGAVTGLEQFGMPLRQWAASGHLALLARRRNLRLPPMTEVADVAPLPAVLNRDQWIVLCPCGTAMFVWPDEPLLMCAGCWNADAGGLWRTVSMPAPARRSEIERLVGLRPERKARNWRGEPLWKLRSENLTAGAGV